MSEEGGARPEAGPPAPSYGPKGEKLKLKLLKNARVGFSIDAMLGCLADIRSAVICVEVEAKET